MTAIVAEELFIFKNTLAKRNIIPTFARNPFRKAPRQMSQRRNKGITTFPNPKPDRDYLIHMKIPEFTCLCPMTGQPDFATLTLDYVADRKCVELKSLKLYIWSYRDEGAFHEAVTNQILDDVVAALSPRYAQLKAQFNVRGGIFTTILAQYRKRGWKPLSPLSVTDAVAHPGIGD